MFSRTWLSGAVLALWVGGSVPAWAETRYIVDVLVVNLRDAPASGAATVTHLKTGDDLEVLGTQGTFLRVRTKSGEEGWVPQAYTTSDTPKDRVIAGLEKELARVKKIAAEAEDQRARLQDELQQTQEARKSAAETARGALTTSQAEAQENARLYSQVKKQYEDLVGKSENVLAITAERDALSEENTRLRSEVTQLSDDLKAVTRSNLVTGLLIGGGLVLVGWLLGSTSRKKKSKYSVT